MLSLLTYGATFGVAEVASTRHELEAFSRKADSRFKHSQFEPSPATAIDRLTAHSEAHSAASSPKFLRKDRTENQTEDQTKDQTKDQTEQEQHATTKGGEIGWLKRLIQRQT